MVRRDRPFILSALAGFSGKLVLGLLKTVSKNRQHLPFSRLAHAVNVPRINQGEFAFLTKFWDAEIKNVEPSRFKIGILKQNFIN